MSDIELDESKCGSQFLIPYVQSTPSSAISNTNRLLTSLSNFCSKIDCVKSNHLNGTVNQSSIDQRQHRTCSVTSSPSLTESNGHQYNHHLHQQHWEQTERITFGEETGLISYSNESTTIAEDSMTYSVYYSIPGSNDATWISVEPSSLPVISFEPNKNEPRDWPIPAVNLTMATPSESTSEYCTNYDSIEVVETERSDETFDDDQCNKLNACSMSPISSSTDVSCYNSSSSVNIPPANLSNVNNTLSALCSEQLRASNFSNQRFIFPFRSYRYQNSIGRIRGGSLLSKEEQRINACKRERVRMKAMNLAFDALRACINPSLKPRGRKFSKIETLRAAIVYISDLNEALNSNCDVDYDHQGPFISNDFGFHGWPRIGLEYTTSPRNQQNLTSDKSHYHLNHDQNNGPIVKEINIESNLTDYKSYINVDTWNGNVNLYCDNA